MDDVITLICVTREQNSIGDYVQTGETRREIYGSVGSVSRAEWFQAGHAGFNPDIVFATPLVNYEGESEAEYRGAIYSIYRTYYVEDTDEIELYLTRKAGVQ